MVLAYPFFLRFVINGSIHREGTCPLLLSLAHDETISFSCCSLHTVWVFTVNRTKQGLGMSVPPSSILKSKIPYGRLCFSRLVVMGEICIRLPLKDYFHCWGN